MLVSPSLPSHRSCDHTPMCAVVVAARAGSLRLGQSMWSWTRKGEIAKTEIMSTILYWISHHHSMLLHLVKGRHDHLLPYLVKVFVFS